MTHFSVDESVDESIACILEKHYHFRTAAIIRRRSVFGIVTEDGRRFVFKPLADRDSEMRLKALAGILPIFQQTDIEAALPIVNCDGNYIVYTPQAGMRAGYLQPWLQGRHVDLSQSEERLCAVQALARIQRKSIEIGRPSSTVLNHASLLNKLRVKERVIQRIWSDAQVAYPALAEARDEIFTRMTTAISRYLSSPLRQRTIAAQSVAFCHRDLAPHNILWQGNGQVGFIDFDHASYDDMFHDAMQLMSHSVYLSRLQQDDFDDLLMVYADEVGMSSSKLYLLRDLAVWPDIVIRTVLELCRAGFPRRGKLRVDFALRQDRHKERLVEGSAISRKRLSAR